MKTRKIFIAVLLAVLPFFGFAQEWDDIRANPRTQRATVQQPVQQVIEEPQRQVVVIAGYSDAMTVSATPGSMRDIDEFNRRGRSMQEHQVQDTLIYEDFQYTDRIVRFHNPESVIQIAGADEMIIFAEDELFTHFNNRGSNVNVHIHAGMGWGHPWGWGFDPWMHPWHNPWGWHAWHRPWGWGHPWGWSSWHAWHSPWGWGSPWGWSAWYSPWGWGGGWHVCVWHGGWHGGWHRPVVVMASNPAGRSTNFGVANSLGRSSTVASAANTQARMSAASRTSTATAMSRDAAATTRTATTTTMRTASDVDMNRGTTSAGNTRVAATVPTTRVTPGTTATNTMTRQSNVATTTQTRQSAVVNTQPTGNITDARNSTIQRVGTVTTPQQQTAVNRTVTTQQQTTTRTATPMPMPVQQQTQTRTSSVTSSPASFGGASSAGVSSAGARTSSAGASSAGTAAGARR